jgi:hypothetical protein
MPFCTGPSAVQKSLVGTPQDPEMQSIVQQHCFRGKGQISTPYGAKVRCHAKALVGAPDIVDPLSCKNSWSVHLKIISVNAVKKIKNRK